MSRRTARAKGKTALASATVKNFLAPTDFLPPSGRLAAIRLPLPSLANGQQAKNPE
jgi:hypothetical protein